MSKLKEVYPGSLVVGTPAAPSDYDYAEVTYPSSTQEVYTYKKNSVTIKTVTINYTSATKDFILNWTIA